MGDNDGGWRTTSFDLPPDLDDDIDEYLERSNLFDRPSDLYRAAIRTFIDEESDEFGNAR